MKPFTPSVIMSLKLVSRETETEGCVSRDSRMVFAGVTHAAKFGAIGPHHSSRFATIRDEVTFPHGSCESISDSKTLT